MRRALLLILCLALASAGCGRGAARSVQQQPELGSKSPAPKAAPALRFTATVTKNTTRIGGSDAVTDAASVAQAVYPPGAATTRPPAVALVDRGDWRAGLAAAALMARPIGAPALFTDGTTLPAASAAALTALAPTGSKPAGNAQLIRVGDVARPLRLRTTDISGPDPFALARAIDAFLSAAHGATSDRVLVVSADQPAYAMPAAAYAAKSGDPVLFARRDSVPAATRAAIGSHRRPRIYVLGPASVIGPKAIRSLDALGTVTRIGGADPVANAIAFSRFADNGFGWGVVDPGHGLVFTGAHVDPQVATAAAPLSGSGTYGPLLLVGDPARLDAPLAQYLLDIQPGYAKDPVRGVYNHGWIVGDERALSLTAQSQIDGLLEISPVRQNTKP